MKAFSAPLNMHFFCDCRVASWRLLLAAPCGYASPVDPPVTLVHAGSRQLLHALPYLRNAEPLNPGSRPRRASETPAHLTHGKITIFR